MRSASATVRLLAALAWVFLVYAAYYLNLMRHLVIQQPALRALADRWIG